jgi:2-oxo-4-hydroxy-4-carboxy-5-ureidoimidazoline decarboxylase
MTKLYHLDQLNDDRDAFMAALAGVAEHSPWVVERVFERRPFRDLRSLHQAFVAGMRGASFEERIALIDAHPELAGREAVAGDMTPESTGEQGRLGLTTLEPADYRELADLNRRYRERFGFPFIAALRLHPDRQSVIASFRQRMDNDRDSEIDNAIEQIGEIVLGRLEKIISTV